eukprot:COSAG06_NODE_62584_length_264_cov_1.436364_1_plen_47_part_01
MFVPSLSWQRDYHILSCFLWLLFGIVKSASLTRAAAVLCLHTLQAAL